MPKHNSKNIKSGLILDNAEVIGNATLAGGTISDNVLIYGNAYVGDNAVIIGKCLIGGNALIYENVVLSGNINVTGNAVIRGEVRLNGNFNIGYNASIRSNNDIFYVEPSTTIGSPILFYKNGRHGNVIADTDMFTGSIEDFETQLPKLFGHTYKTYEFLKAIDDASSHIKGHHSRTILGIALLGYQRGYKFILDLLEDDMHIASEIDKLIKKGSWREKNTAFLEIVSRLVYKYGNDVQVISYKLMIILKYILKKYYAYDIECSTVEHYLIAIDKISNTYSNFKTQLELGVLESIHNIDIIRELDVYLNTNKNITVETLLFTESQRDSINFTSHTYIGSYELETIYNSNEDNFKLSNTLTSMQDIQSSIINRIAQYLLDFNIPRIAAYKFIANYKYNILNYKQFYVENIMCDPDTLTNLRDMFNKDMDFTLIKEENIVTVNDCFKYLNKDIESEIYNLIQILRYNKLPDSFTNEYSIDNIEHIYETLRYIVDNRELNIDSLLTPYIK